MKRLLLSIITVTLLLACSTKKEIVQQLDQGNYDLAINNALIQLQSKKTEKRKSKFISILKDGFDRITKRDLDDIAFLEKDNSPENDLIIFEMYLNLDSRQRAIEPVLPLYLQGKEVKFHFNDYTDQLIEYKNKASDYLYSNAINLLNSENKLDIREAYDQLSYLNDINPNYKDVNVIIEDAYTRGLDYVLVALENDTQQIIPQRLEEELLNFNTYGLNNMWTIYHTNQEEHIAYDFGMHLKLQQITISPEMVNEREQLREREIIDGWDYVLDENGNVLKDSLGNDIKIDRKLLVRARVLETQQSKSAQVSGQVIYKDMTTNNITDSFPISSAFSFINIYARFRGDERALTKNDKVLLRNSPLPFPTNEQLVYDTGEDLKIKLKHILNNQYFGGR